MKKLLLSLLFLSGSMISATGQAVMDPFNRMERMARAKAQAQAQTCDCDEMLDVLQQYLFPLAVQSVRPEEIENYRNELYKAKADFEAKSAEAPCENVLNYLNEQLKAIDNRLEKIQK